MKIKNQLRISIITFTVILVVIAASIFVTEDQTARLNNLEATARSIQTGASNLNYISTNYFLYQENSSISQWETQLAALTNDLAQLNSTDLKQQTLVNNVNTDILHLDTVFDGVVNFLETAPRNVSVRVLPEFQTEWSRIAVQVQAITFDSQQLSQSLRSQADQANFTNIMLIAAFLGIFGLYFVTNYLITYRRTLKSISDLQTGISIVGSGNLDYALKAQNEDEIGDISNSVNKMTANLKTVTASKADLEKEITERLKAEEELRTLNLELEKRVKERTAQVTIERNRLFEVLETLPALICIITPDHHIEFANRSFRERFGESNGRFCYDYCFGNSEPCNFCESLKPLETGKPHHWEVAAPDGSVIDAYDFPFKDIDGSQKVLEMDLDITTRKRAEAELRQYQDHLEQLVENRTKELHASEQVALQAQEIAEKRATDLEEIQLKLEEKASEVEEYATRMEGLAEERARRNKELEEVHAKLQDKAAEVEEYATNMEQLAEERASKLKDSERLAAIGATAGMVGHDIRNPLQAISSDMYLAKSEVKLLPDNERKESIMESIEETEKNVDYINKIVQDLQDFARPLNPKAEQSDIKQMAEKILDKKRLPRNVKATIKVAEDARIVKVDSYYLNRILDNLMTNSIQAMPEGGKLKVEAYKDRADTILTVQDTGVGIPEEIRPKMFTVMFTTKSKGQGFGLPVVKRMTEALGGTVTFESETGKGTKFVIRLPERSK